MTASILAFLCGSLVASLLAFLYIMHAERVQFYNLQAARSAGYNEGLAIGKLQPLQPLAPTRILKRL